MASMDQNPSLTTKFPWLSYQVAQSLWETAPQLKNGWLAMRDFPGLGKNRAQCGAGHTRASTEKVVMVVLQGRVTRNGAEAHASHAWLRAEALGPRGQSRHPSTLQDATGGTSLDPGPPQRHSTGTHHLVTMCMHASSKPNGSHLRHSPSSLRRHHSLWGRVIAMGRVKEKEKGWLGTTAQTHNWEN